ncbi:MAG: YdbL family protein [Gammaproteobacteria bacterium]|nr:YdbL family protein [Gammaproteobacteria bacterium]
MVLLPFSAFALNLQEAKSQLLVGESVTGYLGVVKPSAGVAALVSDINAKRKTSYQKIAKRNGTSLSAVEQLAAKKAIEKTARGQMIQTSPGGAWIRK